MTKNIIEASDVRQFANGRWLDVLGGLAPALTPALLRPGRHVPCPVHGGTDGFRLFRDADQTGGGVCNTCGTFHDGFALLMWVNRWTFPDVLNAVACKIGMTDERVSKSRRVDTRRPRPKERDRESVIEALNRVWQQSFDPTDRRATPPARLSESQRTIRRRSGWQRRPLPSGTGILEEERSQRNRAGRPVSGHGGPGNGYRGCAGDRAQDVSHAGRAQGAGSQPEEADGLPRTPPDRRGHPVVCPGTGTRRGRGNRDRARGPSENGDAGLVGCVGQPAREAGAADEDLAGRDLGGSRSVKSRRSCGDGAAQATPASWDLGCGSSAAGADPCWRERSRLGRCLVQSQAAGSRLIRICDASARKATRGNPAWSFFLQSSV
jgi:hypothetical protein